MKIIAPKPFTIEAGKRAVLLLHGFTGNPNDVKRLGRYLAERNYTVHAPLYKGHGVDPQTLIHSNPQDWWDSVIEGYNELISRGYTEIAVAGVSLGGIFSLRLAEMHPVKAVITMSAPAVAKSPDSLQSRIVDYAINYKKLTGKYDAEIDTREAVAELVQMPSLQNLQSIINDTTNNLPTISTPIHVLRGLEDDPYYCESADLIYTSVKSRIRSVKTFVNSGHILTLSKEKELVYEEIFRFLDCLAWDAK